MITDKELAQRTREILAKRGWQPRVGLRPNEPLCLVQAAGEALSVIPEYSMRVGSISLRFDRLEEFAQALGFENRDQAALWNDHQLSIDSIFERLECVK